MRIEKSTFPPGAIKLLKCDFLSFRKSLIFHYFFKKKKKLSNFLYKVWFIFFCVGFGNLSSLVKGEYLWDEFSTNFLCKFLYQKKGKLVLSLIHLLKFTFGCFFFCFLKRIRSLRRLWCAFVCFFCWIFWLWFAFHNNIDFKG